MSIKGDFIIQSLKSVIVVLLGIVLACFCATSRAEEKKPEQSLAEYLTQLQTKLDHTAQRANQPGAEGSSVVGLRGSRQESPSKQLYWKGKRGKEPVTPDEVKAFRGAVEQARAGNHAQAIIELKRFQEKYPKSTLLPDVNETLSRLASVPAP